MTTQPTTVDLAGSQKDLGTGNNYKDMTALLARQAVTDMLGYFNPDVVDKLMGTLARPAYFGDQAKDSPADKALYERLSAPGGLADLVNQAYDDVYRPQFDTAWNAQRVAFKAGLPKSHFLAAAQEAALDDFDKLKKDAYIQFVGSGYGYGQAQHGKPMSAAEYLSNYSDQAIDMVMTKAGPFGQGDIQQVQDAAQANLRYEKQRTEAAAAGKADLTALTGRMRAELGKLEVGSDEYRNLDATISATETAGQRAIESYTAPGGGFDQGVQPHDWVMQQANAIVKPYLPTGLQVGADLVDTAGAALQQAKAPGIAAKKAALDKAVSDKAAATAAGIRQDADTFNLQNRQAIADLPQVVQDKLTTRFGADPSGALFNQTQDVGEAQTLLNHEIRMAQTEVGRAQGYQKTFGTDAFVQGQQPGTDRADRSPTGPGSYSMSYDQGKIPSNLHTKMDSGAVLSEADAQAIADSHRGFHNIYSGLAGENAAVGSAGEDMGAYGKNVASDLWKQANGNPKTFTDLLNQHVGGNPKTEQLDRSTLPGFKTMAEQMAAPSTLRAGTSGLPGQPSDVVPPTPPKPVKETATVV